MGWPLAGLWDAKTQAPGTTFQDIPAIMAAIARAINERRVMMPGSVDPAYADNPSNGTTAYSWYLTDALTTTATYPTAAQFSGMIRGPLVNRFLTDAYSRIDSMIGYDSLFNWHYPWVRNIGTGPGDITYWTPADLWAQAGTGLQAFDANNVTLADNWLRLKRALDLMTVYGWSFYSRPFFKESNPAFTSGDFTPPQNFPAVSVDDYKDTTYTAGGRGDDFTDDASATVFAMSDDAHGITRQLNLFFWTHADNFTSAVTAKAAYYTSKASYVANTPAESTWRDGFDLRVYHLPNPSGTGAPFDSNYLGPFRLERGATLSNFSTTGAASTFHYSLNAVPYVQLDVMNGGDKNPFFIHGPSFTNWAATGVFAVNYAKYLLNLAPALTDQA